MRRFWDKVLQTDYCWVWVGAIGTHGYGVIRMAGKTLLAHRVGFELGGRKLRAGMQLDHLCRNRRCVRPGHLEPVSNRENMLRGDHQSAQIRRSGVCKGGHVLTKDNTYIRKDRPGNVECRTCRIERCKAYRNRHGE